MSEKGGKALKSNFKSAPSKYGSLGGKDDNSSAKSRRVRKVQFDSQGTPEPKFKFLSESDASFASFGAKGDKGFKAGKTASKEPQPLELKLGKELPENAQCLMDCEAAQILEGIQEQMVVLSEDPKIKIPVSFARGLQYAKSGCHYANPKSVRQLLDSLKKHDISDGEICVIADVCPENVDEAFALVPSLKAKRSLISEPLKDVLAELSKLKKST